MLTKEEMDVFETFIRETLAARKSELGLSDERLGKAAFPQMSYPRTKIQAILVGQGLPGKRKPQNLRFADVITVCEAMGLSWTDVGRDAIKAARAPKK